MKIEKILEVLKDYGIDELDMLLVKNQNDIKLLNEVDLTDVKIVTNGYNGACMLKIKDDEYFILTGFNDVMLDRLGYNDE